MHPNLHPIQADSQLHVVIRAARDLSDDERWNVQAWQAQIFDLSEEFATVDWYVFGLRAGQWVSMLEMTERTARVDQQPIMLALIGSVVTIPQWRHHGYASTLLEPVRKPLLWIEPFQLHAPRRPATTRSCPPRFGVCAP